MQTPTLITSQKLSHFSNVKLAISTRNGGVSPFPLGMNLSFNVGDERGNVLQNRQIFFNWLGFETEQIAFTQQCHSDHIVTATKAGQYKSSDGLLTNVPNLPLAISVADCLPVFVYDSLRKVVAAIHAGWRGTASRIVEKGVRKMIDEFGCNAADCFAFLGPSAGVCCYEVGVDVAHHFDGECVEWRESKHFLNLKEANKAQLVRLGVKVENIEVSPYCTICSPDLFHSYRRDKEKSGRMLGVISLIHQAEL